MDIFSRFDGFKRNQYWRAAKTPSIAVITGGCGGIGFAIVAAIVGQYRVFVIDKAAPDAAMREYFSDKGVSFIEADLSLEDEAARAFKSIQKQGSIKILCCVAGGSQYDYLRDIGPEAWRSEIDINLNSAYFCVSQAVSQMVDRKSGGVVINIASVNGLGAYGHAAYSVAKAGLIHLTRMVAVEYGKHNIRAVAVAPGTVITKAWAQRAAENPTLESDLLREYPGQSLPTVDDVAALVAFLISDAARCITGCCIPVDSGLTAGAVSMSELFTQTPLREEST